jgi:hypothetical protein
VQKAPQQLQAYNQNEKSDLLSELSPGQQPSQQKADIEWGSTCKDHRGDLMPAPTSKGERSQPKMEGEGEGQLDLLGAGCAACARQVCDRRTRIVE